MNVVINNIVTLAEVCCKVALGAALLAFVPLMLLLGCGAALPVGHPLGEILLDVAGFITRFQLVMYGFFGVSLLFLTAVYILTWLYDTVMFKLVRYFDRH